MIVLCRVALAATTWRLMFRLILFEDISFLIKIDTPLETPESSVMYVIIAFNVFFVFISSFSLRSVSCRQITVG